MANPFLVLGGVAVGVVTAGIGVLAVPGWINAAQEANALNDLSMVADAQSARLTVDGFYAQTLPALSAAQDVRIQPSEGAKLAVSANADRSAWLGVSRAKTGIYLARLSGGTTVGKGLTLEEAVTAAGTTISGPATSRITAEGVPLPQPWDLALVAYENLHPNPGATSFTGYYMWQGTTGQNTAVGSIAGVDWSLSKKAYRITFTTVRANNGDFSVRVGDYVPPGATFTVRYRLKVSEDLSLSAMRFWNEDAGTAILASSHPASSVIKAGEVVEAWATVRVPTGVQPGTNLRLGFDIRGHSAGTVIEFGDADLYLGPQDAARPWFYPGVPADDGFRAAWTTSRPGTVLYK
ncbi:hypothetical protein [Microbacterium hominis]|uniref:Uncharacterized protein n=1 Tax=Microbacterium hominis TaxID=162426 RepID=A0A2K9DUF8_9MICO|nr:hypothetical protein [Microbacterium hominis]AUG29504.1 hypothetical protein CXR34_08635 [Microbacterium hominis]EPD84202.1 hypothetical protein HMPREF1529_02267 [Microbacterium sp. oral taxon 186 str. F0373]